MEQTVINLLQREVKQTEFFSCHLTVGEHRGRDVTMGKVKEIYRWPNFYKEIKEKVHVTSSNHFTLNISM